MLESDSLELSSLVSVSSIASESGAELVVTVASALEFATSAALLTIASDGFDGSVAFDSDAVSLCLALGFRTFLKRMDDVNRPLNDHDGAPKRDDQV